MIFVVVVGSLRRLWGGRPAWPPVGRWCRPRGRPVKGLARSARREPFSVSPLRWSAFDHDHATSAGRREMGKRKIPLFRFRPPLRKRFVGLVFFINPFPLPGVRASRRVPRFENSRNVKI